MGSRVRRIAGLAVAILMVGAAAAGAEHAGPLAAQWHLDAASPQGGGIEATEDSSGHALTASANGVVSIAPDGRFGNHLSNVNTSLLQVGPSPLLMPNRLTVVAWIRHTGTPPPYRYIAGQGDDGGTCLGGSYALYTGSVTSLGLQFFIRQAGGTFKISPVASNAIWDGGWHMAAGVFDGSAVRLYVDGVEVGTGNPAPDAVIDYALSGTGFYFGGYPPVCPGGDFPGGIDELRVYSRALSATELARLATASGPDPPELVADDFDPPETTLTAGPADGEVVGDVPPTFEFDASEPGSTFECRTFDPDDPLAATTAFQPCTSPHTRSDLIPETALGESSVFEVRASDSAGNVDPTPASRRYVKHAAPDDQPMKSRCDPVIIVAAHGRGILQNCRIVRIRDGEVPCMQINTLNPRKCQFERDSGRWIEAEDGEDYAVVGEAISPDGDSKGKFIVVAPIGKERTSPCGRFPEASTSDSAGTATGIEFASFSVCWVEVFNTSWNTGGRPMENFATREVCTSDFPHPDGAMLVSTPAAGVYCYRGTGAGLNDNSGIERDPSGQYFTGRIACHIAWSGGYEIYAAKRPAVRNYPAPAKVDPRSPIRWRPVAQGVRIAN